MSTRNTREFEALLTYDEVSNHLDVFSKIIATQDLPQLLGFLTHSSDELLNICLAHPFEESALLMVRFMRLQNALVRWSSLSKQATARMHELLHITGAISV